MALTEHTLNDELGSLLGKMRKRWRVQAEPLGEIEGSAKRPDILITEDGALPLIIEHEISPARNVEREARERIGLRLRGSGREVRVAIALRSPSSLIFGKSGALLRRRWLYGEELRYVMYRRLRGGELERWPAAGWLEGTLRGMALFIQQAMRPGDEIDALADILELRIEQAANIFNKTWPQDDRRAGELLREHLRLEDDGVQTRRMAMAILANALIFQQSLAPQLEGIEPPSRLYVEGQLTQETVVRQWRRILEINYWPIFHVASEILAWMDRPRVAAEILGLLHEVNLEIERSDAARSHDLTGFVFQRLIADRKFLATFYTRPESAALLAALTLPMQRPLAEGGWNDPLTLSTLQIGDFACGTGTLLSAVYNRLGVLHELHGGDAAALHKDLLEYALVGCDVLPMALHLTLTMLASAYPEIRFDDCHMLVMPYGRQHTEDKGNNFSLGALDLLAAQEAFPTWSTRPDVVSGNGETSQAPERHMVPDSHFDIIIMNPPFTRPNYSPGEGQTAEIPAFAALGTSSEAQIGMRDLLTLVTRNTVYHGQAGIASAFLALADKKLRASGTVALVLPQVFLSGIAWEKARTMIRQCYRDIIIVTIAGDTSSDKSFSADTDLGECLLVASKGENPDEVGSARFVTLEERPRNQYEGVLIGERVHTAAEVRRLEDGPYGGKPIRIGEDDIGHILDAPLPESGPWQIAGISDIALAQSAWQLARGILWLPQLQEFSRTNIPVTALGKLITDDPPHHSRIECWRWNDRSKAPSAPFKIHRPPVNRVPTWPTLWAHDANRERCMEVAFDSEAIPLHSTDATIRANVGDMADTIWATATRLHINRDFRFNSQSLCVAVAPQKCIGGHAWPSIIFPENERVTWDPAFCVWGNSTLGIFLFWWEANRQQGGRGRTSVTAIPDLPTLDLRALSEAQLAAAARIFEDMKHCPMLPVNQIDEDPVRAELDRRLLTEVLGLPAELCAPDGPMALLRRKLAAEPSIHGGKLEQNKVRLDVPAGCLPE